MSTSGKDLTTLGTRVVFNRTLRHIVNVSNLIDSVERGGNLADLLNKLMEDGTLSNDQVSPILSVILVSRMNLPFRSANLPETVSNFDSVVASFKKWNNVDMVIAYHHPNLGILPVNPSNASHWASVHEVKKDELIVVYVRALNNDRAVAEKALDALFELLAGKTPAEVPGFIDAGRVRPAPSPIPPRPAPAAVPSPQSAPAGQAAAPQPAAAPTAVAGPAPAGKNLTPKYSVQVSNELFHNGNVEAWKNIIESYQAAYPDCKVIVYHEGELIQDLNSLFKWGKVKHGGLIMFQVAGATIKGVSRLQKYLYEGASKRYEAFMKHDVNKVLSLF
ncbi:MAG: hypothetical protein HY042_08920 [Spirochaetia bacterium]|nr:hypothetical protein [Spirochaetia bacterium]